VTGCHAVADFSAPASEERIQRAAAALRANNIEAIVVDTADDAKREVLERIPDGAEVHSGASKTLQQTGIQAELEVSGKITWLRKRLSAMDRTTQSRDIRKLSAAPDVMLGSVTAVTEDGRLITASNSGSQIGPYAASAGKLILVIGAQKVVKDLDEAMRRTYDHALPLESERLRAAVGVDSYVSKILITNRDARAGRTTAILVREALGF
jgi:acyl-CoA hydrolase